MESNKEKFEKAYNADFDIQMYKKRLEELSKRDLEAPHISSEVNELLGKFWKVRNKLARTFGVKEINL